MEAAHKAERAPTDSGVAGAHATRIVNATVITSSRAVTPAYLTTVAITSVTATRIAAPVLKTACAPQATRV